MCLNPFRRGHFNIKENAYYFDITSDIILMEVIETNESSTGQYNIDCQVQILGIRIFRH